MITTPLIVAEGLDLHFYNSADEAGKSLEPWWVLEERGRVYDAEGRLLKLETDKHRVRVLQGEDIPKHSEELRSLLHAFLAAVNQPIERSSDLKTLLDACTKVVP